jgi:hypothetical protein
MEINRLTFLALHHHQHRAVGTINLCLPVMIRVMKIFQNVNKNYVIYGKNPLLSLQRLLFVIMQWHVFCLISFSLFC